MESAVESAQRLRWGWPPVNGSGRVNETTLETRPSSGAYCPGQQPGGLRSHGRGRRRGLARAAAAAPSAPMSPAVARSSPYDWPALSAGPAAACPNCRTPSRQRGPRRYPGTPATNPGPGLHLRTGHSPGRVCGTDPGVIRVSARRCGGSRGCCRSSRRQGGTCLVAGALPSLARCSVRSVRGREKVPTDHPPCDLDGLPAP
jgi:hypothetical protein